MTKITIDNGFKEYLGRYTLTFRGLKRIYTDISKKRGVRKWKNAIDNVEIVYINRHNYQLKRYIVTTWDGTTLKSLDDWIRWSTGCYDSVITTKQINQDILIDHIERALKLEYRKKSMAEKS